MMRVAFAAVSLAVAVWLSSGPALASTQFLAYEGRDAVHEGQGGEKKVVDGVDFWMDGSPPHRFQVLGSITDERWKSGLYGLMQVSRLEHDIAKEARTVGGDAVIITDSEDRTWGVATSTYGSANYGNGWAYGGSNSVTRPYGTRATRYVVVKYLPDESPTSSPPQAAPSAAPGPPPAVQQPEPASSAATPTNVARP